jgi:protein SCO1
MKARLRSLSRLAVFLSAVLALPLFAGPGFSPKVPDVEVVTHEGKKVHFYRDLVQGNAVAVNFVFTNCSTICPASGAMFATLQKQSGQGVRFISVSIDPGYDTPERLAAWSRKFRTQPGWVLVTGEQSAIDAIVKAFGAANARPQDHQPLTIIGSDVTQTWAKLYGFPDAEKVRSVVADVRKGEAR